MDRLWRLTPSPTLKGLSLFFSDRPSILFVLRSSCCKSAATDSARALLFCHPKSTPSCSSCSFVKTQPSSLWSPPTTSFSILTRHRCWRNEWLTLRQETMKKKSLNSLMFNHFLPFEIFGFWTGLSFLVRSSISLITLCLACFLNPRWHFAVVSNFLCLVSCRSTSYRRGQVFQASPSGHFSQSWPSRRIKSHYTIFVLTESFLLFVAVSVISSGTTRRASEKNHIFGSWLTTTTFSVFQNRVRATTSTLGCFWMNFAAAAVVSD